MFATRELVRCPGRLAKNLANGPFALPRLRGRKALDSRTGVPDAYAALARSMLVHFENEEELIFADAPSHLDAEARRQVIRQFEALAREA